MEGAVGKKRVKKFFLFFYFFLSVHYIYICITGPFPTDCNMYNTVYCIYNLKSLGREGRQKNKIDRGPMGQIQADYC